MTLFLSIRKTLVWRTYREMRIIMALCNLLHMRAVISVLFFFIIIITNYSCSGELIKALPGQPANVSFKQYSGYIVTDAQHGRALFYYFAEAESVDPLSRPLTLWLAGGPGCSSLGFSFLEHGPFQPDENGSLLKNEYSWNRESNMLYVESPIGVGFSYSNTSSNYILWNDTGTAEDNLRFIVNWLEEFPKFKDSDLYITGESYAGHYVPQLAALVVEYNKQHNIKPLKLKAIALGNPLLDVDISAQTAYYLWSHGAISDATLELVRTICNDSRYFREFVHQNISKECNDVINIVEEEIGPDVNRDSLLLPRCLSTSSSSSTTSNVEQLKSTGKVAVIHATLARRAGSSGDPCIGSKIFSYLNNPQVQKALHANPTHWNICSGPLVYQLDNLDMNLIPLVSYLIRDGIPLMLFSGDQDTRIPFTQTRIIANILAQNLKLIPFTKYAPWYDKQQVGGWAQSFGALKYGKNVTYLTFATVRGGAHEVPFTNPSEALTVFKAFLSGSPLPTTPIR